MKRSTVLTGLLIFCILAMSVLSVSAQGSQSVEMSQAFCTELGIFRMIEVSLLSNLQGSGEIVVLGVLHNSIGQTLEVTTAEAVFNQGENQTVYLVINLPIGNYSTNVFAWTPTGVALTPPETISC